MAHNSNNLYDDGAYFEDDEEDWDDPDDDSDDFSYSDYGYDLDDRQNNSGIWDEDDLTEDDLRSIIEAMSMEIFNLQQLEHFICKSLLFGSKGQFN